MVQGCLEVTRLIHTLDKEGEVVESKTDKVEKYAFPACSSALDDQSVTAAGIEANLNVDFPEFKGLKAGARLRNGQERDAARVNLVNLVRNVELTQVYIHDCVHQQEQHAGATGRRCAWKGMGRPGSSNAGNVAKTKPRKNLRKAFSQRQTSVAKDFMRKYLRMTPNKSVFLPYFVVILVIWVSAHLLTYTATNLRVLRFVQRIHCH